MKKIKHLFAHRTTKRFLRYFAVGGTTFLFDMLLIVIFTRVFQVHYQIAVASGFLIAVSVNYFLSRKYVFKFTDRKIIAGYLNFFGFAMIGAGAVTFGTVFFTEIVGLYFIFSRIIVSGIVGIFNYLFNLHHNFKVAGKDL